MRIFATLIITFWALCPAIGVAQADPGWARREMERMQAQQERFDAQVERQQAEQERFNQEKEREAARRERQRVEQERSTVRNRSGTPYATGVATPSNAGDIDNNSSFVDHDRIGIIFELANRVCRDESGQALDDVTKLLPYEEFSLLIYFCFMYNSGKSQLGSKVSPKK